MLWAPIHDTLVPENAALESHGVRLIRAEMLNEFSLQPGVIAFGFGQNSGFQAINLAMQFGARHIILVGFDCRVVDGRDHFFGSYPADGPFIASDYQFFLSGFEVAAQNMPPGFRIVNATPDSAITSFSRMSFADALDDRVLWDISRNNAAAG